MSTAQNWKRALFILWIAQFISAAALSSIVPFLPLFILELGITDLAEAARWSGYIFSAPFVVFFFVVPLWGAMGDRYGQKLMTVRAVIGLAIAFLLMAFAQNVTHLLIFRLLQGLLSGFYPAALALAASLSPKDKSGYSLGLIQSANTSGTIIGPLFGGMLANLVGFRGVFVIVAALVCISAVLVIFYIDELKKEKEPQNYSPIDNWKFILKDVDLRLAGFLIFLTSFGISLLTPVFVFYIESFGIPHDKLPLVTGALYGILGIFSTVSSALLARRIDSLGMKRVLFTATLVISLMYSLHFFIYSVIALIPVRIMLGLGYGLVTPALFAYLSRNIPVERKAGIMSIGSSFNTLGNMIGPLTSGFIAAGLGIRYSFLTAGVAFFLVTVLALKKMRG